MIHSRSAVQGLTLTVGIQAGETVGVERSLERRVPVVLETLTETMMMAMTMGTGQTIMVRRRQRRRSLDSETFPSLKKTARSL